MSWPYNAPRCGRLLAAWLFAQRPARQCGLFWTRNVLSRTTPQPLEPVIGGISRYISSINYREVHHFSPRQLFQVVRAEYAARTAVKRGETSLRRLRSGFDGRFMQRVARARGTPTKRSTGAGMNDSSPNWNRDRRLDFFLAIGSARRGNGVHQTPAPFL
jgi:hypothetical protein